MEKIKFNRPCTVKMYNEITDNGIKYYVKVFDSHTYETLMFEVYDDEKSAKKVFDSIE